MVAIRVLIWLFGLGAVLGCGRTGAARGIAGNGAAGAGATSVDGPTNSGSSAVGGALVVGGSVTGGATGGTGPLPVDPSLEPPALRLPQNGRSTGSAWSTRARRPRFVWDPQPGFTFELQADDSCEVGDHQSCEFPSPEWLAHGLTLSEVAPPMDLPVSETAPVGRRYYWRARSCSTAACSPWSLVRYVDVGRQHSDFDGDGFADVILADQGSTARQGRVLIGFGPAPSNRTVVLEDAVAPETPDHFGETAKALGDMDADGFADLLVTAPGDQQDLPGVAYVYFGSATFADAASRERLLVQVGEPQTRLTSALPAGDVDADGRQDFVIASHPSGSSLYLSAGRAASATPLPVARPLSWLRQSSTGDVTGDGYSDLLLVSSSEGGSSSRYDLLHGSAMGLSELRLLGENDGYPLEWWTIAGDLNRDGFSDLGKTLNYTSDPPSNRIDVTWGAAAPRPDADPAMTWAGALHGSYANLGQAIATGDVDGDGFDDSLAGVAWHTSDVAQANLYLGGSESRTAPDAVYAFQTGVTLFICEGLPSAAGDVNGDGSDDILLSEDYSRSAQLFFGGASLDAAADDHLGLPLP